MCLHARAHQLLLSQQTQLEMINIDTCSTHQTLTRRRWGLHTNAWQGMAMPLWGGGRGHMKEGEGVTRENGHDRNCIMRPSAPSATL